ncbi:response regulator transcription factor [Mangrovibacterium lignilyticum]|uniref:response regulator transcription factor n=1 Tax=Mangrovibacterium lignilyticum TaxID=2668052 RepID=UPI0013D4EC7E|nr:response regulator transcription factor [Mangrovibacterium lignilyticum]
MKDQNLNIFLLEDDLSFGAVLKSYLELNDYEVTWVDDGKYAVERFRQGKFQLCLLDVMLPNVDGFSVGEEIRTLDKHVPFIFLTAKAMKQDVLKGYEVGADDYVTKPFDTEVLLCKIKAILSRGRAHESTHADSYEIGSYRFHLQRRSIVRNGIEQKLSPKEAELLELLVEYKNDLLPRETALRKIWGDDGYFTARSMDVYLTKLRKYLSQDPAIEIRNIHSSGFILQVLDDPR